MTDLISREAALRGLSALWDNGLTGHVLRWRVEAALRALPAVQVDRSAEYLRGWNDAMGSTPKRVIDNPALFAKPVDASQTPDPDTKMRCAECWCDDGNCKWIATGNETEADPVLTDPRVKALVEQVRALLDAADGESYAAYNAALEATDAALRAIGGEA